MKKPYKVVRKAVNKETLQLIKDALIISKDVAYHMSNVPLSNQNYFSEYLVSNTFPFFGNLICESLLVNLQSLVEKTVDKKLYPTYSYGRIYWTGSSLLKHVDRPSCEYSISLCIDVDPDPWAIFIDGKEVILNPGDLVVYQGGKYTHWRETYHGNQQIQVFLHYVDQEGPYKHFRYDTRPMIGLPEAYKGTVAKIATKIND